jgi:hypothetical protein
MTGDGASRSLRDLIDRRVSVAELRQALERPLGEDEREDVLSLARWFRRRYPSGAERLAYVRQAYARWRRTPEHLSF